MNNNKADTVKKNYLPVIRVSEGRDRRGGFISLRIMKYQVSNGKTDSGIITTATFDQMAKEYLMPGLDSGRFENKFEEISLWISKPTW